MALVSARMTPARLRNGRSAQTDVHADETLFKHLVYLPVTALRRQRVARYLRSLEQTQSLPMASRQELQLQRLRHLVGQARARVPHYRDSLRELPDIRSLDDLRSLPFVCKQQIKECPEQFRADPVPYGCVSKTTGGSTGEPLTILKTPDAMAHELAATWRAYRWAGVDIGARQARLWGVPFTRHERLRAALIDFVCHRRRCSAFAFDAASMATYDQRLKRFKPTYLYGYLSMIVAFARYYRDRSVRPSYPLRCIITTSEVLTDGDRALIEEVFNAPVYNEYGCGELGTIAHECEYGSLHINDENMIVEVLDGERQCTPGEKGELVVTELNNVAMPLIRYRTGDFGACGSTRCPCGRTLTILDHVFGRAYDFVVDRDGRRFHGEFLMYVFEEAQRSQFGIAQFQVQQETLSDFRVRIVPGAAFDDRSENAILSRMQQYLGHDINVRFDHVAQIPREPSGKLRVIVGMDEHRLTQAVTSTTRG